MEVQISLNCDPLLRNIDTIVSIIDVSLFFFALQSLLNGGLLVQLSKADVMIR